LSKKTLRYSNVFSTTPYAAIPSLGVFIMESGIKPQSVTGKHLCLHAKIMQCAWEKFNAKKSTGLKFWRDTERETWEDYFLNLCT